MDGIGTPYIYKIYRWTVSDQTAKTYFRPVSFQSSSRYSQIVEVGPFSIK